MQKVHSVEGFFSGVGSDVLLLLDMLGLGKGSLHLLEEILAIAMHQLPLVVLLQLLLEDILCVFLEESMVGLDEVVFFTQLTR